MLPSEVSNEILGRETHFAAELTDLRDHFLPVLGEIRIWRRDVDPGGSYHAGWPRDVILRVSVVGGGFLRTGCGPGPLEPDLGNSSEGNTARK